MAAFRVMVLVAIFTGALAKPDPCSEYEELDEAYRSTSFEMNHNHRGKCDAGLRRGWYRFTSTAGGVMPESCVQRFKCGTLMPMWLNGSHPTESDGEVSRIACVNFGGLPLKPPCCEHHITIGVKKCKDFFVYYLRPPQSCPASYCAGDKTPCPAGQSSPTGFTPCEDAYPEMDAEPTLSPPEVRNNAFRFNCDVNYAQHDPDLSFEVQWTFDGQPDTNIPNIVLNDPQRRTSLPGTALRNHMGQDVACRVRPFYRNRQVELRGPWKESDPYWAGITIEPKAVEISEKGGDQNVTVTSTIPIVCDYNTNRSCCLYLALDADGPKNNVVVPHPCQHTLCASDWDTVSHTASTDISIVAAKDIIRDGNNHNSMLLSFEKLQPGGSGPYLDVFTGYSIPPAQVSVKDEPTQMCSWNGDPHFNAFSRNAFHLFDTGDFTVYENPSDHFEIQTRTNRCNGAVSCQCGLAIREHNDVIRIDNCRHPYAAPHIDVSSRTLRVGTNIQRSRDGRHIMIYLPSGREVKVTVGPYYHNVVVTVPGSDMNKGRGLCGTLDGRHDNEYTHRNGQGDVGCRHGHACVPGPFLDSWKNTHSTSLFETKPADLNQVVHDPHYCQCDTGVGGTPRINCTVGADVTHRAQRCGSSSCHDVTADLPTFLQGPGTGWARRDVTYADHDEPNPPFNFTKNEPRDWNTTWPTASGITEAQARERCSSEIRRSQLYSHCQGISTMLHDSNVEDCITDVLFGDNYDMVESAVAGFTAQCHFQLIQDPSNWEKDHSGNLLDLKAEIAEVCSVTCLRHGRCVRGQCVCDANYTGSECQLNQGQPPTIQRVRGSSYCDLVRRPCRTIFFDADHFEASENFSCRVDTVLPSGQVSGHPMEQKAAFLSGNRLSCGLPSATNQSVTHFAISVTYDGQHYSNAMNVTVFDSTCQTCDNQGCTQKADTCLIDDLCHQDGDHKTDDATKMCNTSASISQWTNTTSGTFPAMRSPILTGPDVDWQMTCAVRLSGNIEANARFEVTWYTDDGATPVGKNILGPGQLQAITNFFDFPSNAKRLQCKSRSFYDGQTTFSPYMASDYKLLQSA